MGVESKWSGGEVLVRRLQVNRYPGTKEKEAPAASTHAHPIRQTGDERAFRKD